MTSIIIKILKCIYCYSCQFPSLLDVMKSFLNIAETKRIMKTAVKSSSFLEFSHWMTYGCHCMFLAFCHLVSIVPYPVNCEFCRGVTIPTPFVDF